MKLADPIERAVVTVFYSWLVWRNVSDGTLGWGILQILSEGLIVVFTIFRRPALDISVRPQDWVLALGATVLPMLATAGVGEHHMPGGVAVLLLLAGLALQIVAKLWLGTRFGLVAARRGLATGGPYRLVRHPIYAGYLLTHLSIAGMNPTPVNLAVYAGAWALQIPRLLAEERLLSADEAYRAYLAAVRWRLLPGVF
jgi:protein-S-isoprenylcysteine O-methyltransferase Ste14